MDSLHYRSSCVWQIAAIHNNDTSHHSLSLLPTKRSCHCSKALRSFSISSFKVYKHLQWPRQIFELYCTLLQPQLNIFSRSTRGYSLLLWNLCITDHSAYVMSQEEVTIMQVNFEGLLVGIWPSRTTTVFFKKNIVLKNTIVVILHLKYHNVLINLAFWFAAIWVID